MIYILFPVVVVLVVLLLIQVVFWGVIEVIDFLYEVLNDGL